MVIYRVKKVVAWAIAMALIALMAFGGYYLLVEVA